MVRALTGSPNHRFKTVLTGTVLETSNATKKNKVSRKNNYVMLKIILNKGYTPLKSPSGSNSCNQERDV